MSNYLETHSLSCKVFTFYISISKRCTICRCGFAQSQKAYDKAVDELFSTLDMLDDHLGRSRYLCGENLTLADVCLFTTLIRFDLVYNVLFKCTKKKLLEYDNLHGYMRDIYQVICSLNPATTFDYLKLSLYIVHARVCNQLDTQTPPRWTSFGRYID